MKLIIIGLMLLSLNCNPTTTTGGNWCAIAIVSGGGILNQYGDTVAVCGHKKWAIGYFPDTIVVDSIGVDLSGPYHKLVKIKTYNNQKLIIVSGVVQDTAYVGLPKLGSWKRKFSGMEVGECVK